jgi:hypothetical protein
MVVFILHILLPEEELGRAVPRRSELTHNVRAQIAYVPFVHFIVVVADRIIHEGDFAQGSSEDRDLVGGRLKVLVDHVA